MTAPAEPPPATHGVRAAKVAAFIILTGPLIGSAILSAVVFGRLAIASTFDGATWQDFSDAGSVVLLFVVFGYLLATVPCVLAGAYLAWRTYHHGGFGYGLALGVAAVATIVGSFLLDLTASQSGTSFLGVALFMLPLALTSAVIVRWILGKICLLPANRSASLAQS